MMAGSTTCSNQRPDTLMQDRIARSRKSLATHGRTIHWVKLGRTQLEHFSSGLPPKADSGASIADVAEVPYRTRADYLGMPQMCLYGLARGSVASHHSANWDRHAPEYRKQM